MAVVPTFFFLRRAQLCLRDEGLVVAILLCVADRCCVRYRPFFIFLSHTTPTQRELWPLIAPLMVGELYLGVTDLIRGSDAGVAFL